MFEFDSDVFPLFSSKEEEREHYLNSKMKCSKCKCIRKVKNCKVYVERESWEMPWIIYEVRVCPKCGHDMEEI